MKIKSIVLFLSILLISIWILGCSNAEGETEPTAIAVNAIEVSISNPESQKVMILGTETKFSVNVEPSNIEGLVADVNVHGDHGITCVPSDADKLWTWYCTGTQEAEAATIFVDVTGDFPDQSADYDVKVVLPTPTPEPIETQDPNPTPESPETPGPTETPRPTPPGMLVIESPVDGAEVPLSNDVTGSGAKAALESGTNLYVIVQPHGHNYWVQALPAINEDGTWSAKPVLVGQAGDAGHEFDICAVLTIENLERGKEYGNLPDGSAMCITVKREQGSSTSIPDVTPVEGSPLIESPDDGDIVPMTNTVIGSGAEDALNDGTNLYVIVQPGDFNLYVQAVPIVNDDGTWSAAPVMVGNASESGSSLPFHICAVLTDVELERGDELGELPEGLVSCITVKRE